MQPSARQDPQGSPSIQPGMQSRLLAGLKVILNIHLGPFPTSDSPCGIPFGVHPPLILIGVVLV